MPATGSIDAEKLLVTSRALQLRRERAEAFGLRGAYVPVNASSDHAVAFTRGGEVAVVVTRLAEGLALGGGWGDAVVDLPPGPWTDRLSGRTVEGGATRLAELLDRLPVALLVR